MRSFLLTSLILAGLWGVSTSSASAQSEPVSKTAPHLAGMKDGVYRQNGVTMRLQAGRATRLTAPLTLANGTVVRTDGIIISSDGTRQLLRDGYAVNMQGNIVLLADDMQSATAIEQHNTKLNGSSETVIAGPVTSTAISPLLVAEIQRTERRLALLQQLASQLDERAKAAGAGTNTAALDEQIRQIDGQLQR